MSNYESFEWHCKYQLFQDHVRLTEYGAAILFKQWIVLLIIQSSRRPPSS